MPVEPGVATAQQPMNIGTLALAEDSGAVTLINMPVSATPTAGDDELFNECR